MKISRLDDMLALDRAVIEEGTNLVHLGTNLFGPLLAVMVRIL